MIYKTLLSTLFIFYNCGFFFGHLVWSQALEAETRQALALEIRYMQQNLNRLKAWKAQAQYWDAQLAQVQKRVDSIQHQLDQELDILADLEQEEVYLEKQKRQFLLQNRNQLEGVVFRIQVQAAPRHPADRFAGRFPTFTVFPDGGLRRYLVGHFFDYREAKQWTEWLKQRGATAYVVGFKKIKSCRSFIILPTLPFLPVLKKILIFCV
ncbi:MAG: hypothetical protein HC913_02945 [Microscillaceae bacterium]|nr:hypothetical protein [Microscillaceae bacterium]